MKRSVLLVLLLALAGCKTVLFGTVGVLGGHHAQRHAGIVFDSAHDLRLDVYTPRAGTAARGAPVVVFFYGGAWINGERGWYRYAGEALAAHGVVAVVPDYRKAPQVRFPAFMDDAAQAVAWTRAHASDYGGDAHRLFVMGHSAGAQIGALLATDAQWLAKVQMAPRDLSGFIGLAGPYDFAPFTDPDLTQVFGEDAQAQARAMPVNFVDGDEPPMLLLQGTKDTTVWPRNARSLADKLRAQHEPVETRFYENLGHTRIALSLAAPFTSWSGALADTLDFIDRHRHE